MYRTLSQQVSRSWERLSEIQNEVATGKRVERPDDDPTASFSIGAATESMRQLDDCTSSGKTASSYLEAGESALAEATNIFIRVKELAVQGASDQNSAAERSNMALEVRQMYTQLVSLANTEVNGCHLFAGYLSNSDAVSGTGVYQGDSGVIDLEVAPGMKVAATIRGDQLLAGSGGGVDLFATLDALATALETNNVAGIQSSLDTLDRGQQQLINGRSQIGAQLNTVATANSWIGRLRTDIESNRSALQDTDLAQSSMQLALAQQALQAAIDTVPKMVSQNLIGKL
jgi:flagellar hook-associated protein 3 FlgL